MTPHCVAEGVLDDLGEEDLGEEVLGEVDDLGPGLDSWEGGVPVLGLDPLPGWACGAVGVGLRRWSPSGCGPAHS